MNILFSRNEKEKLKKYKYSVDNNAISSEYLDTFWNKMQTYIPNYMSPNIISLLGFICTLCAFLVCHNLYDKYSTLSEILTVICILGYANLDSIDGIHARATNNASPLGEFIDHSLDSFSTILLVFCGCKIFGINEFYTTWATIRIAQLNFLMCHVDAYINDKIYFSRFFGPTEILFYWCILIVCKIFGFNYINEFFKIGQSLIIIVLYVYATHALKIIKSEVSEKSTLTFWILTIGVLMSLYTTQNSMFYMLLDSLPLAMMSIDIILCKMTGKSASLLILLAFIVSKYDLYLSSLFIVVYFSWILYEISTYLEIPILQIKNKTNKFE